MDGRILCTGSFDDGSGKNFEPDGRIVGTIILDDGRGEENNEVDGRAFGWERK